MNSMVKQPQKSGACRIFFGFLGLIDKKEF